MEGAFPPSIVLDLAYEPISFNQRAYQSKYQVQRNAKEHQLFSHSAHSWQVDKINEPPVEPLPVSESILTKAGLIVATGSVECESKMKGKVKRGRGRWPSPSVYSAPSPSLSAHL